MLSKIKEMFHTFPYIVTGVLWACAIFISIFNRDGLIPASLLWQILAVSFLCVLGILIYPQRKMTKRESVIRRLLHYLYINVIVFGSARVFHWFDEESLIMNLSLFLTIVAVFFTVSYTMLRNDRKISALLNEHLQQYQNKI